MLLCNCKAKIKNCLPLLQLLCCLQGWSKPCVRCWRSVCRCSAFKLFTVSWCVGLVALLDFFSVGLCVEKIQMCHQKCRHYFNLLNSNNLSLNSLIRSDNVSPLSGIFFTGLEISRRSSLDFIAILP